MSRFGRIPAATTVALALACATGSTYEDLAASMPPIPAGQGRIFVFLSGANEVPSFVPHLTLDGMPIGTLRTGTYLYVDRPVGPHVLDVHVREGDAAFGAQTRAQPLEIMVTPAGSAYVEADTLEGVGTIEVTLTPVGPENGPRDLRPLQPAPEASE
jgi:hypothetical protein